MGRSFLLGIVPLFVIAILSMAIPGGVVIEFGLAHAPESGASSPLTVSIQKGGLDYFGRILIMVPDDCTLAPKSLHGGSFAWDEGQHRAVVSWLKLPEADRFDLVFELKVEPGAPAGRRELTSEFSFIRNQDRASVTPPPYLFEIRPFARDTSLGSHTEPSAPIPKGRGPTAKRHWSASGPDVIVHIEFEGLDNGGFTKLTELVPATCDLDILNAGGGTAQKGGAGFSIVWFDGPPNGPVTYRLGQCELSNAQSISGSLSVIHNEKSLEIDVIPFGWERNAPSKRDSLALGTPGITFEVQVAATKNAVVTDYFEEKFNFRLATAEVRDGAWWKYSTGSKGEYAGAKILRNEIRDNFDFLGPFVVANENERRISVQEALVRTGQKWSP